MTRRIGDDRGFNPLVSGASYDVTHECAFRDIAAARVVIISPHCDDAAFSLGGLLHRLALEGNSPHIINCFSYSGYTLQNPKGDPTHTSTRRKSEDAIVAHLLGDPSPSMHYLDLMDAPLRLGRPALSIPPVPLSSEDKTILASIALAVQQWLNGASVLFAPLAIGGHIDHRISRCAGERAASTVGVPVFYYEDQPYRALSQTASDCAAKPDVCPVFIPIDLAAKVSLMECYRSQLTAIQRAAITRYAVELGAGLGSPMERAWLTTRRLSGTH